MNTEQIIYNMLVENTGIHFLDSGMGSGRHWQKNQVKKLVYPNSITIIRYNNQKISDDFIRSVII